MSKGLAFSNNDIAVVAWAYDRKLAGCLGFAVYRGDVHAGTWTALPALARFASTPKDAAHQTTEQAPVQKFWWKDLGARRGGTYQYKIVPLGGAPGHLEPLHGYDPIVTNSVTVTHDRGSFKAYFNRGIVATQALAQKLGTPSAPRLKRHIIEPGDDLRSMLSGEIEGALEALLDRADETNAEIRAALYELNDPKGLEVRLQGSDRGNPGSRTVVLGNARESKKEDGELVDVPDADKANRDALRKAGANVVDRILPAQHIPHNKFLLLKQSSGPVAVLTGSTNWTSTGLCTQTNNALVIENAEVAQRYADYWDQLEKDTEHAHRTKTWQGQDLRDWARAHNADSPPIQIDNAQIEIKFSPNTQGALSSKHVTPAQDMDEVFTLMRGAKQAILFLAFDPGNTSILDVAGEMLKDHPSLFVRGALTSAQRAENFADALEHAKSDGHGHGPDKPHVALLADKRGAVDFRGVPAGAVSKTDTFGIWQAELQKVGHAIIHDKIVVIDPFSDDCVVVTGSHNLGYRASHNNDENFVIVKGHRALAEAYACHVLDIYDHFAWRFLLHQHKDVFGRPLADDDSWQDWYLKDGEPSSAELRFWLSAEPMVDAHRRRPHR